MNVPIRILGVASTIFWVFLIAFVALAAYSVKDLSVDFGEPDFSLTAEGRLSLALPLYVDNRGYYNLKEFFISTIFLDYEGEEISRAETYLPVILHGENLTIIHNVALDPISLLGRDGQYLFHDNDLSVSFKAGLNFADVLPSEISANFTFPWGAPFYNFDVGELSFNLVDFTHATASVPVSFENHAFFDLAGNIRMELYDCEDSLLTESQTVLYVPRQSSYDGNMEFNIPLTAASLLSFSTAQSGHLDVYFDIGFAQYGPLVIPYD